MENQSCTSDRNCSTHKYNTNGLFSAQYSDDTSLHCGQQNIGMPDFMKINGGAAISGQPRINYASGDYQLGNNGPYFQDIYTGTSYSNGRNSLVQNMSMQGSPVEKKQNGTPMFTNIAGNSPYPTPTIGQNGQQPAKENYTRFPEYTDFTSQSAPDIAISSAGRTNTHLTDNVCGKNRAGERKGDKEKFSLCGINIENSCAILGVIVGIIVIVLMFWLINKYSRKSFGKPIFKGGMSRTIAYFDTVPESGQSTSNSCPNCGSPNGNCVCSKQQSAFNFRKPKRVLDETGESGSLNPPEVDEISTPVSSPTSVPTPTEQNPPEII